MFCTNCGTKFEGNFCSNCGTPIANTNSLPIQEDDISEAIDELLVYDGTQELYDISGTLLDPQHLRNAYKDEPDTRKFLKKYTDYELEEIDTIISYIITNIPQEQLGMLKRGALQIKLESKGNAILAAQAGENKKNGIACPMCKSDNIQISLEQVGTKVNKKRNSIIRDAARGTMILSTGGLWALTPKADGKEKGKIKHSTYGICQDCGNSWVIKK